MPRFFFAWFILRRHVKNKIDSIINQRHSGIGGIVVL